MSEVEGEVQGGGKGGFCCLSVGIIRLPELFVHFCFQVLNAGEMLEDNSLDFLLLICWV